MNQRKKKCEDKKGEEIIFGGYVKVCAERM